MNVSVLGHWIEIGISLISLISMVAFIILTYQDHSHTNLCCYPNGPPKLEVDPTYPLRRRYLQIDFQESTSPVEDALDEVDETAVEEEPENGKEEEEVEKELPAPKE